MNYAQTQRNPIRHGVGIGLVVLLHILIFWGLANGLSRKVVQVAKAPIETRIIEEVKPPPPPPLKLELPPPPRFVPPPPAFVPPPEVLVKNTPPPQTTITATVEEPPPAPPPVVAPRAVEAPAPAPVAASAPPVTRSAAIECPNYKAVLQEAGLPREAVRAGVETADLDLMLTIATDGTVKNVAVTRSTNRLFNRGAAEAARQIVCKPQPHELEVPLPVTYRPAN